MMVKAAVTELRVEDAPTPCRLCVPDINGERRSGTSLAWSTGDSACCMIQLQSRWKLPDASDQTYGDCHQRPMETLSKGLRPLLREVMWC